MLTVGDGLVTQVPALIIRTISDKANADSPTDFPRFLPTVARNSMAIVKELLEKC